MVLQGDFMHFKFRKKMLFVTSISILASLNVIHSETIESPTPEIPLEIIQNTTTLTEPQISESSATPEEVVEPQTEASLDLIESTPETTEASLQASESYTLSPEEALELQAVVLQQLDKVKIALQHIAHLVQARAIKHAQPFALLQWTQKTMHQINEYQTWMQSQQPSLAILGTSLSVNKALIQHVLNALRTQFAILQDFSMEQALQRSTLLEITEESLKRSFAENDRLVRSLDTSTKKLGISYVNKFFRTIDHIVHLPFIQPTLKLGFIGLSAYGLYKGLDFSLKKIDTYFDSFPTNHDLYDFQLRKAFFVTPFTVLKQTLGHGFSQAMATVAVAGASNLASYASGPFVHGYKTTVDFASATWGMLKGDAKDASLQEHGLIIEDITLDHPNLVGLEVQKQQLMDNIVRPLMQPDLFLHTGMELERAVALIGPSRNGKTLIARALCGTINAAFKAAGRFDRIGFREIPHWYIKQVPLKAIIEEAQRNGPMVLFIDEYHLLRPNASGKGRDQELVEQLTELETLYKTNDPSKMVFLVIATNRPDMLATELFSHKRFGLVIRFGKPNHHQRTAFFTERAHHLAITLSEKDITTFVAQTQNRSYGELDQVFQDAKVLAKNMGESLQAYHIQQKINAKIHSIKPNMILPEQERRVAAAHYAGHVLAHDILQINESIELVTINGIDRAIKERSETGFIVDEHGTMQNPNNAQIYVPRYGKMVTYNSHESVNLQTINETLHKAQVKLAGALAEEILLGNRCITYHTKDRQKALNLIKTALLQGLTEKQLPEKQKQELMEKALVQLDQLEQDIREKLRAHKDALLRMYNKLYEEQLILKDELHHLIHQE